jgi:hypothetical protein
MPSWIHNSLEVGFVFFVGFSPFWVPVIFLAYAVWKRTFSVRFLLMFMGAEFLSWRLSQWVQWWAFKG